MSNEVFAQLQQKANEAEAIGGTLKFVIDDLTVFVDGTGNGKKFHNRTKKPIAPLSLLQQPYSNSKTAT